MSKILLVNPPFYRFLGSHYNANSLGIAYIASVLNKHGHCAYLYNADFVDQIEYSNLKSIFKGYVDYKKYFEEPDNYSIWNEVVEKILEFNPDWIGYTCYTANVGAIDIISSKIRKIDSNIKQVVGGPHSTLDREILNRLKSIDYAVSREGEQAMLSLVEGKDPKKISGVASRNSLGFIVHNGDADVLDVDLLPFPEREKFWGLTAEQCKTVDVSYVVTVRGCPYRCNYCASPYSWKRNKTQYRGVDSIMDELHFLKENYWNIKKEFDYSASANASPKNQLLIRDNTLLYFVDDIFTIKKKRIMAILTRMISENINMPWKCEARADHLDSEICDLMAKAKCKRVKIGFESGSDRILKQIQKDETKDKMLSGAKMLRDAGVPFTGYFMIGFPGETDEDAKKTIEFAKSVNADYYSLSILSPYFGTKMYYDLIEQGYELDKQPEHYFYHQSPEPMVNKLISKSTIEEFMSLNENKKSYV